MNYRQLAPDDRAQLIRERLATVERQHFSLSLKINTASSLPGGDPEEDAAMYDLLGRHIADLHTRLDELEGARHD